MCHKQTDTIIEEVFKPYNLMTEKRETNWCLLFLANASAPLVRQTVKVYKYFSSFGHFGNQSKHFILILTATVNG